MSRAQLSDASRVALGPPTRDALDAAQGDRRAAARALGISLVALYKRIAECSVPGHDTDVTLRGWLAARWPRPTGPRAVEVLRVVTEPGVRVYVLAAHGGIGAGEHVNRVPAVGKIRGRVVCQVCKEARTT